MATDTSIYYIMFSGGLSIFWPTLTILSIHHELTLARGVEWGLVGSGAVMVSMSRFLPVLNSKHQQSNLYQCSTVNISNQISTSDQQSISTINSLQVLSSKHWQLSQISTGAQQSTSAIKSLPVLKSQHQQSNLYQCSQSTSAIKSLPVLTVHINNQIKYLTVLNS